MKLIIKGKTKPEEAEPKVEFDLVHEYDGSIRLIGYNDMYAGMVLLTIEIDGTVKSVHNGFEPLGLKFEG